VAIEFSATARRLGIFSAASVVVLGLAYAVTLTVGFLSLGSPQQPIGDPMFSILEVLIILMDVNVSAFLFRGLPGAGPGPHRHPYDEVQFIQEGHGTWLVNGQEFEAGAGDILVIRAGEIHSFEDTGETPLVRRLGDAALQNAFETMSERQAPAYLAWRRLQKIPLEDVRPFAVVGTDEVV
jgi:quercetin dioxygenase-like cupin family protein